MMSSRRRLSDLVVTELESQILSGRLRPGDRVPTEIELGEELGVSRSVVRDAIQALAARQLITVRHGHGMQVADASDTPFAHALADLLMRSELRVGQILDAREALERQFAPLAVRNVLDEDVDAMERSLSELAATVKAEQWPAAHESHLEFHLGLVRALHLPALELFLRPVEEVILLSAIPPSANAALWEVESHQPYVNALRERDEPALVAAIDVHFRILEGRSYKSFRALRFRELVTHKDFAALRSRITTRSGLRAVRGGANREEDG